MNGHKNEDLARKGLKAAKYTVIFRVLSQLCSIVVTILLVRALSEHDYGIYNIFYSVIGLMSMVASFGLANTLQRYIPEYGGKGEHRLASKLYRAAALIRLFSNVLVLGLCLVFWERVAPVLKITPYKTYFMLFTLIVLLHMQKVLLEIALNSYFMQKYSQGFSVVFVLLKGVGYAAALGLHLDLWYVLITDLAAYTVVFLLLQVVYTRKVPRSSKKQDRFDREERKRITRYALFCNFNDVGTGMLSANFDNFILVMYLNPVAVGAYAFCQRITKMLVRLLPLSYLLDVIRPALFTAGAAMERGRIRTVFRILVKINYLCVVPIFFFLLVQGAAVIRIFFHGKFLEYSSILSGVFFFSMLNSIQIPVGLMAHLREKADAIFYSKIFALYNLIADVVFIRYLGIWGAVIATGTAILGKNLFLWYFVREYASFQGTGPFFMIMAGFWGTVAGMVALLNSWITPLYLSFPIAIVLFVLAFLLQFHAVLFNREEKEILLNISRKNKRVGSLMRLMRV